MEPGPDASSPAMPELTLSAPSPVTSVEAVSAVLESFLSRFEAAGARMGGKKRPLPETVSGDASDADSDQAAVASGSVASEDADLVRMDSGDDSVVESAADKEFIGALISAVRDTLNIEDVAETPAVSVPFGFRKPPRAAKVFPCVPYLDSLMYKEWDSPQKVFTVPKHFATRYPLEEGFLKKWVSPPSVDPPRVQAE